MDKHEIGVNAGKVWELLSGNTKWNYESLKRASELNDKELAAAIGWLAREDKIEFEAGEDDEVNVYLNVNVYIG